MLSPIARQYLYEAIAYAGAGALTKAVGSAFRVKDDWHAPDDVFKKTLTRESALLIISGLSMMAIQLLFSFVTRNPSRMVNLSHRLLKAEPLIRLLLVVPAFIVAEAFSRVLAPRNLWKTMAQKPPTVSLPSDVSQSINPPARQRGGNLLPVTYHNLQRVTPQRSAPLQAPAAMLRFNQTSTHIYPTEGSPILSPFANPVSFRYGWHNIHP